MNSGNVSASLQDSLLIPLGGAGAPVAMMSLVAAGDMGFGDDHNRDRRELWLQAQGFDPQGSASVDLVHSRIVIEAPSPSHSRGVQADGLLAPALGETQATSGEAGLEKTSCLVITVADCMPIFLYDAGSGAFGLLHSGWRGTGILAEAVVAMKRLYGTRASQLRVAFGPRIGACCYAVDEDRAIAFAHEFGSGCVKRLEGRPHIDLLAANLEMAQRLGLGAVSVASGCTSCDKRFGSFRRQGAGHFTRMAAVLGYRTKKW